MDFSLSFNTPVGRIVVTERDEAIVRLTWTQSVYNDETPLLVSAKSQLTTYFEGQLKSFDLPVAYDCSAFQQRACEAMCKIPYGTTVTYGELAESMQSAAQPVGNACGGNPIAIIIPCHRVLSGKDIGGYSGEGGIETKIALLRLENAIPWLI